MNRSRWELAVLVMLGAVALSIRIATTIAEMVVARAAGAVLLHDDALHNSGDPIMIVGAWTAWLVARRPPTTAHPWGLGRIEDLATLLVGLMIGVVGLFVLVEALERWTRGSPRPGSLLGVGLMAAGATVAYYLAAKLLHYVGRRTGSTALAALGDDARADMWVSIMAGTGALLRGASVCRRESTPCSAGSSAAGS